MQGKLPFPLASDISNSLNTKARILTAYVLLSVLIPLVFFLFSFLVLLSFYLYIFMLIQLCESFHSFYGILAIIVKSATLQFPSRKEATALKLVIVQRIYNHCSAHLLNNGLRKLEKVF